MIRSHRLSDDALADLLPKRRGSEVRRLREVLHEYHLSGRYIVPDESMAVHLARVQGELICAACGAEF